MGPRIYPSYQDTNLSAKGTLILSIDTWINFIDIYINNQIWDKEYKIINGLCTIPININDIIRLESNEFFSLSLDRIDYTTDDINGDNGIRDEYTFYVNTVSSYEFVATTSNSSYNFEYRIGISFPGPTPTPTVTPTSTPTITPTPTVTPTPTPTLICPTPIPNIYSNLPYIITSGLTIYVDGSGDSYDRISNIWYNRQKLPPCSATVYNNPIWSNSNNGFFTFNGVNQYAYFGASSINATSTTGATFGGWVNMNTGTTKEVMFSLGGIGNVDKIYELYVTGNTYAVNARLIGNIDANRVSPNPFISGNWYYVIGRWNRSGGNSRLSLFVNGVWEGDTIIGQNTLKTSTNGWWMALQDLTDYETVKIGSFETYNRALLDAEILTNFNSKKSLYGY